MGRPWNGGRDKQRSTPEPSHQVQLSTSRLTIFWTTQRVNPTPVCGASVASTTATVRDDTDPASRIPRPSATSRTGQDFGRSTCRYPQACARDGVSRIRARTRRRPESSALTKSRRRHQTCSRRARCARQAVAGPSPRNPIAPQHSGSASLPVPSDHGLLVHVD
jgi:hypothetical protein